MHCSDCRFQSIEADLSLFQVLCLSLTCAILITVTTVVYMKHYTIQSDSSRCECEMVLSDTFIQ